MPGDPGFRLGAGDSEPGERPRGRGAETRRLPDRPGPRRQLRDEQPPPPQPAGTATPEQADLRQGVRHARHRGQVRATAVHRGPQLPALQPANTAQEHLPQQHYDHQEGHLETLRI